ncbi:MAG: peptide-N-glycosidase F-related protein [Candidatus Thalassarchaeaceae archaeon]|nr:peptide-N-glycosidase F-related protein [Candidatus Thalassarchaeaceae archaeon]
MRQRFCMALLFTAMLFGSGCLGAISPYDDMFPEDVNVAPELTVMNKSPRGNSLVNIDYDERVILSGTIVDEKIDTVQIEGQVSSLSITMNGTVDESGNFSIDFGILDAGDHSIKLTAIDENNLSHTIDVQISVLSAPEIPVQISALIPVIYAEEGSFVTARVTIVHSSLHTCQGYWIDNTGRNFSVHRTDNIATASLGYIEYSYNGSFTITCGTNLNDLSSDSVNVSVVLAVEENPDSDGDGVLDVIDNCINSLVVFTSGPGNDLDGDGCQDISEDNDDDSDNREDGVDNCARGLTHWDSNNQSLDWDSDGCHDESEDSDDDADSILDIYDKCPRLSQGWVSTITEDYDRDGCHDELDDLDDDDDSIPDEEDDCPRQSAIGWIPSNESDYDSDGCRDADEDGDDDNDGVTDFNDLCLRTILGSTVNEFGCAPYEWDSDNDGVMDDTDQCMGTPSNTTVNLVGCADLDGDGVFANVDQCPNSEVRWTADANGCTVLQIPIAWSSGPYSTERFGKVGDFTIQTKYNGNWKMSRDWDGESSYLFIMNQDSSSYMSSLWSQNVGRLLDTLPENNHIFFGSFDSDYRNDIDSMNARVNSYRNGQSTERQSWIDSHVHYIDQQGGAISGSFGNVINDWSSFYYGIDRFQQWREIGSLSNWAGTHGVQYRFDYIGKMAQQFNSEFPTEMRRHDPGVTVVDIMINHRHSGGWQGGHSSLSNGTFPNATEMLTYNTMEIYMHHGCSEHRDRYQKSDGSYGGCHEWDYSQYLQICDEVGNTSTCSREFGYWITTYGREGRWMTDISSRLFELQDGGEHMFRYRGANGGWLNVSVYLSTWDDDGLRPTSAEYAFSGGSFRGQYNNESQYKRVHDINIPEGTEKVEIYAVITGHGFGKDSANCAEFCNHEHRYSMNGYVTQEDHPMAGNSTIGSDDEGCAKQMHGGALANQLGSWPYGRAGWCAGQDVKPWTVDISDWINWNGGTNSLRYQGLYNGQNYIPQNEQSGANQNIHANVWIVYYSNISSTSSLQLDTGAVAPPSSNVEQSPQSPSGVFIAREEECTSEDD